MDAAVIGGKDRWKARLDGLDNELLVKRKELSEEDEVRASQLDRTLRDLRHLRMFALPLIARLDALPSQAVWGEWID